jgi:lysophospholipase L1-like esterase
MRRTHRPFMAAVVIAAVAVLVAVPAARADEEHDTHYYLSLGDSYAESNQPNGDFTHGYAEQLREILAADDPKLKLVKLGCSGESTASIRFGDPSVAQDTIADCGTPSFYLHRYPHKTQLAEAVAFLHAHKDKVALVTIDIGVNDIPDPFELPGSISDNLPAILAQLRAAAAPDVPIVGMNYPNVFLPFVWESFGMPGLQFGIAVNQRFNDYLEGFYEAAGMPVADVESAFSTTDVTIVDGTPLNVRRVCEWTWFCNWVPPDFHPNTTGYGVIARAFAGVL